MCKVSGWLAGPARPRPNTPRAGWRHQGLARGAAHAAKTQGHTQGTEQTHTWRKTGARSFSVAGGHCKYKKGEGDDILPLGVGAGDISVNTLL